MARILLKLVIFALLWVIGMYFFASFGGSMGTTTSMLFIGESITGSNLAEDGDDVIMLIISFIITAAVYYVIAEVITFILLRLFGGKK